MRLSHLCPEKAGPTFAYESLSSHELRAGWVPSKSYSGKLRPFMFCFLPGPSRSLLLSSRPLLAPLVFLAFSFLAYGPQSHPSSLLRIWALSDPSPPGPCLSLRRHPLAPINFLLSRSTHIWPPAARLTPAGLWGLPETLRVLSLSPPASPGHPTVSSGLKRHADLRKI